MPLTPLQPVATCHCLNSATSATNPQARTSTFNIALKSALVAMTLGSAVAMPAAALAQSPAAVALPSGDEVKLFNVPAGPLDTALERFARTAGVNLAYDAASIKGLNTQGLSGKQSIAAGLTRLLAGTRLEAVSQAGGGYSLRTAAPTARQAPARPSDEAMLSTVTVRADAEPLPGELPKPFAGGQVARGGRLGLLGNIDFMDTPFGVTSYTSQLVEDQQAQNIGDVLINDPAVRNTYSRGSGREEFNVRGFSLFNYDVSFNGLYGISPRNASSLIGIERVEVLRGPNAMLNGMAPAGSVGGAINLVPKRAGAEPLNRMTLSYIDDGQLGAQVDLARRFGQDKEWGMRLNALKRSGDIPADHASEELGALALGIDYQGDGVRIEADLNHQDRLTHARSSLLFPPAAGTAIATVPDARTNFQPEWTYWDASERSAMVRAEIDLAPDWTVFGAMGTMQYEFTSLQTAWLLQDDQGNLAGRPTRLNELVDTRTAEAGLRGKFDTGSLRHEPVLSISTLNADQGTRRQNGEFIFSSLYTPATNPEPLIGIAPGIPKVGETRLRSVALADTISTSDRRIQLTLGVRHQQVETSTFDAATSARNAHYDESASTPTAALVVKATDALSIYGNYIEGLSQGPTAPTGAVNAGEMFPPAKSKQIEFGTKFDAGRFATTLSVFQIERPSGLLDPVSLQYRMDGQQRNRGIELITQGEAHTGVRLLAGAAYTDGTLVRTLNGMNDGRAAPATPKLQLNASGEWDTPFVQGLTLTARALRTSAQFVDAGNTQQLPAWTRFDIGARYRFMTGNVPVTIRAAIENLLDKHYWQSAAREGLTIGAPRTFLVSVSADF
jgi:iron complex outermembrane receptor protein